MEFSDTITIAEYMERMDFRVTTSERFGPVITPHDLGTGSAQPTGITATVIADSDSEDGYRVTTVECRFPRIILAEVNTHRVLSRNSASSRALPTGKILDQVTCDPFIPCYFGKPQSGMQSSTFWEHDSEGEQLNTYAWLMSRDAAVKSAGLMEAHKQYVNRLLEPFMWHTAILTGSAWQNLLNQRARSQDPQPEFWQLARCVEKALGTSTPIRLAEGEWHLPYITDEERQAYELHDLIKLSIARCARVSYLTHDGIRDIDEDVRFTNRLLDNRPPHTCYDSETEVLTEDGWKMWPLVSAEDRIAAVDISNMEIAFERAELCKFEYSGNMYSITGQQVDLCVTPSHNLVASTRLNKHNDWSPFTLRPAQELFGRPWRASKVGDLRTVDRQEFPNPTDIPQDTWMRLVGFFIGDGHAAVKHNPNRITFHLKKSRKIEWLRSLGIPYLLVQASDTFAIAYPGIGEWFRENCYSSSGHKVLPAGFLRMTRSDYEHLKDGLRNSDGSQRRNTWTYSSTSNELLDQIQALSHVNGEVASLSGSSRPLGRLNFSVRTSPRIEVNQRGRSASYAEGWVPYSGSVWCATVSTGALLVRRNGKAVVCGNSPSEHQATPDVEAPGNLTGFRQFRHTWELEAGIGSSL